jgi:hypothetical protein
MKNGWQRQFEDPIELSDGRTLTTLRDAADYITALPKKEAELPEWQAAIEALLLVSRGRTNHAGADRRHTRIEPACGA